MTTPQAPGSAHLPESRSTPAAGPGGALTGGAPAPAAAALPLSPAPMPYDLTLSDLTLRQASFATRVNAAAMAGFGGIGLSVSHYHQARAEGLSDADLLALLAEHGLRLDEVELAQAWADPSVYSEEEREADGELLALAARLGVRRIHAELLDEFPVGTYVAGLRELCARAADSGALVAVEYMPYAGVYGPGLDWTVVEASEAENAGILIDTWHWARAYSPDEQEAKLAEVPADRIAGVQLSDALAEPAPRVRHESAHLRQLPGLGYADLRGLLNRLQAHGTQAPVSVEVQSDALDSQPPALSAHQAYVTASAVLERAGWPCDAPAARVSVL
ncbi:sugar phosphate isomerase/epimerase family protein [Phaeacidiphilus oryzae]|uniref:sugar phosphate isomerase/epimerase family protein n=1 Tax=Phaeacidiphilus oryzae TaxID=348818 RepID=UPI00068D57D3|nr:TIM barrel protein [Phaeacidiphilus oryzae]